MIKIASFLAILGVAVGAPGAITYAASPYVHAAPVQVLHSTPTIVKTVAAEPFDPNPQYNYGYSVQDSLTGDSKVHTETRNGDVVTGQYSLVEPDGSIRTVTYTADSIHGFNAVVDRQAPAVAVKSVVQSAPVQVLRSAPVYQAAPVPVYHAAPAHQIAYKHFL